jgi:DNA polymerase III epsilon subunit-like protein
MYRCLECKRCAVRPHRRATCPHVLCEECAHKVKETCPACHTGKLTSPWLLDRDLDRAQRLDRRFAHEDACATRLEDEEADKKESMLPLVPVFMDLETTDKEVWDRRTRIVQIAHVTGDGRTYESKVRADQRITAGALKVIAIRDAHLVKARPCKDVLEDWLRTVDQQRKGAPVVLVAYNGIKFDFPLLFNEMHRWDIHPYRALRAVGVTHTFDPYAWVRVNMYVHECANFKQVTVYGAVVPQELKDKHNKIIKSIYGEDKNMGNAHDALVDCFMLEGICNTLKRPDSAQANTISICDDYRCEDLQMSHTLRSLVNNVWADMRQRVDRTTLKRVQQKLEKTGIRRGLLSMPGLKRKKGPGSDVCPPVAKRPREAGAK